MIHRGTSVISVLILISIALMSAASEHPQRVEPQQERAAQRALLDRYCVTCHTQRQKERGIVPIAIDNLDLANVAPDAEVWEKVIRKVRAGVMPPAGAPRPDQAASQNFIAWFETQLDRAAEMHPNPG